MHGQLTRWYTLFVQYDNISRVFEWNGVKKAMLLKYVLCVCEDYLLTQSNIESYGLFIIEISKQKSRLAKNLPCICLTCGFILCFR